MHDVAPSDMVTLLCSLAEIQHARATAAFAAVSGGGSGRVGSAKNAALLLPGASLPAFRGGLLSAVCR
jgi:hypothetical protein